MNEIVLIDFGKMKHDFLKPYKDISKEYRMNNLAEKNFESTIGCAIIQAVENYIVGNKQLSFGESVDRFLEYRKQCEEMEG